MADTVLTCFVSQGAEACGIWHSISTCRSVIALQAATVEGTAELESGAQACTDLGRSGCGAGSDCGLHLQGHAGAPLPPSRQQVGLPRLHPHLLADNRLCL